MTQKDLRVLIPAEITDADLISSNVPETDHPAWGVGDTYADADLVIHEHAIWMSAADSNTGNEPSEASSFWARVSATNRWKAFDQVIAQPVENPGSITYTIEAPSTVTGIAFFGLQGSSLQITTDAGADSGVIDLVDTSEIADVWSYFTWDGGSYEDELIVQSVGARSSDEITITITGAGTAKVGQIVMGRMRSLGIATGADLSIEDNSIKEYDEFGGVAIVERSFTRRATFSFALAKADARRVRRVLIAQRASPAVYTSAEDRPEFGTMIYGWPSDWAIPENAESIAFATLEISGLQE